MAEVNESAVEMTPSKNEPELLTEETRPDTEKQGVEVNTTVKKFIMGNDIMMVNSTGITNREFRPNMKQIVPKRMKKKNDLLTKVREQHEQK